ncbi:MAG: ATP-binding protein [Candidatus Methanoperedens sp.]|nr:ATP-binding protein [Candidatus Methanoperedens sp.]
MKIGRKIILGFVVVSLIIGFGWYFSIYTNNLIVDSFEQSQEHFGSIIEASNELSSYAKRAEGHAMLYLTLNNGSDKKKFYQRIDSLREQISIIENNVTNQQAKNIVASMRAGTDELRSTGESLFQEHDNELNSSGKFEFENHEKSIRRLDDVAANIRQEGLTLAKLEIGLQQEMNNKAKMNADNIQKVIFLIGIIAVIGSLSFGYGISRSISNPVMKLRDAAENIGRGNLDARIEFTSKDEIGELAAAFNRMGAELQNSITEQKRINEMLRASEERFRTMFNSAAVSIALADLNGRIIDSNPAFEKLLGYSLQELRKMSFHDYTYPEDIQTNVELFREAILGKINSYKMIKRYVRKDGTVIWASLVASVVKDADGKPSFLIATMEDITEIKRAEDIRFEKERLEFANRAKSEFLATMSHELRTPLNSIIGFSELLIEGMYGELNEKQAHYINNVITSSKFLLDLINDILDLSKVEAGKIELVKENMSVPGTISETLILIKEKASTHNVVLNQVFDPQLDVIEADKQRFKQILFNLLSNAVKFSKKEGGTVTITAKKDGDMAKFSVSDTGIGIKEEDIGKLFKEFAQANPEISHEYGGTGLGLAITRRLVELHGGEITVESRYGEGSTFTFTLPLFSKNKGDKEV